jgi:5'-deoxynucleotidase YfbR-like HD superfamily hydrolase
MSEGGEEKVVELGYLETPKGPVARFESVKQLAELIVELNNELDAVKKMLEYMKTAGGVPENLENRLRTIEDQLTIMSDDMREVLNALGELSATVAQIKKALKL